MAQVPHSTGSDWALLLPPRLRLLLLIVRSSSVDGKDVDGQAALVRFV